MVILDVQSVLTVLPTPVLAPSWQVAFGRTILVSHFLFPLTKLSPGDLFCCFPFIPLNFLRVCCLCWDDFEVQAGCAGVTVMQAVVRALLSFRAQAHQSYRLHEILCLSEQVSCLFWLLQGSKHYQQSQEFCNGFC